METRRTIEINGVKLDVDLSTAKKVDEFRVGDSVKVLIKNYDSYQVYPGVIIGFENFKQLPTIAIAYLDVSYSGAEIKFAYFNNNSKDVEIAQSGNMEIPFEAHTVIKKMDQMILAAEQNVRDLKAKKEYFINNFRCYFKNFVEGLGESSERP